jgi:hypothetical protein
MPSAATCVLDDGVPGFSRPSSSAREITACAIRSLTLPVGFSPLEFHEDVRTLGWYDLPKSNHRCVSNSVKNIHGLIFLCAVRFPRLAQSIMHIIAPASSRPRVHNLRWLAAAIC